MTLTDKLLLGISISSLCAQLRWRVCTCMILVAISAVIHVECYAQSDDFIDESTGGPAVEEPDAESLKGRLESLMQATHQLRQQLNDSRQQTGQKQPQGHATASTEDIFPPEKLRDIEDRIQLIRRLREASRTKRIAASTNKLIMSSESSQPATEQSIDGMAFSASEQTTRSAGQQPPLRGQDPSRDAMVERPDEVSTSTSAFRILPQPIDSLQLAYNLYLTGNPQATLSALGQIPIDELSTADRSWLEMLAALSNRKLQNTDAAISALRKIANYDLDDYQSHASWWLQHTEQRQTLETRLTEVSLQIDTLMERYRSHVK